jgi:MOSC domain-containing protein YiiM
MDAAVQSDGAGSVTAVCITMAVKPRTASTKALTGIDKRAVGAVTLTATGVEGDRVLDTRFHGGVDKAVYAYADEDADWWAAQLGTEIPPGRFGENLRTRGIDVTGAIIGERWEIGDVLLEVSEPRVPCATFQHHMDDRSGWVRRFTQAGRTGAYLRVLQEGEVAAGAPVVVRDRPSHGISIGKWFADADADAAQALLAAQSEDWAMAEALHAQVDDLLR